MKPFFKRIIQMLVDYVIALVALSLAYLIRFEGDIPAKYHEQLVSIVFYIGAGKVIINYVFGNYKYLWRYASLAETLTLVSSAGFSAMILVFLRLTHLLLVPLSICLTDFFIFVIILAGSRIMRKVQYNLSVQTKNSTTPESENLPLRTMLVGAGESGSSLIQNIVKNYRSKYKIICALDDDPLKLKSQLHGVPVIGNTTALEKVIREKHIDEVFIAMPKASKAVIHNLIAVAQQTKAKTRIVPSLKDLMETSIVENKLNIKLNDLRDSKEIKDAFLSEISNGKKAQRILVTGGAGYIGSHLVAKLLDKGYIVRVLDNFTYGKDALEPVKDHPNLEIIEGDIAHIRDVVRAVKGVKSVIALAAIVGDPACGVDPEETLNLNYEATKILVEACKFYGVERLAFASSCSVYGASSDDRFLDEESDLNPVSLYARTRIMSENIIFERCGDVVPVILRLATVFGLSKRMRYDLVVNTLTVRAVKDKKIQIFGGNQWRPFVHCRDVADAFIAAATEKDESKVAYQIFNCGGDYHNMTIAEVGKLVADTVGGVDIEFKGDIPDPRNYRVTFGKILKTLNFIPKYSIEQGIKEMMEAFKNHEVSTEYGDTIYHNVRVLQQKFELFE